MADDNVDVPTEDFDADSSSGSDWDADIPDAPQSEDNASLYTMQSSGGMVTISPAGRRESAAKPKKLYDVPIDWNEPDNSDVLVFSSFDDFKSGTEMEPFEDADTGEVFFTTTLQLPAGRYLIRFQVDGEWAIDENHPVIYSLGNAYNSVTVEDPEDSGTEEDEDDWDVVQDDGNLENNITHSAAFGSSILANLDTSGGMVAISPEMFAAAQQEENKLTDEQKQELVKQKAEQAAADSAAKTKGFNYKWDATTNQFIVEGGTTAEKKHAHHQETRRPAPTAEEYAAMSPRTRKKAKERERRRRKKQRRKEKRRRQKFAFAAAQAEQRNRGGDQNNVDVQAIKEEVVRREREWREAWILHELKSQEVREKEKQAMRDQWRIEREKWIAKLQTYATERNELKEEVNRLQQEAETAQSGATVSEEAMSNLKAMYQGKLEALEKEAEEARSEAKTAREAQRAAESSARAAEGKLGETNSELSSQLDTVTSEKTQLSIQITSLQQEVKDSQSQTEAAKKSLEEAKAEFEVKLQEAKKDFELAALNQTKSVAEEKSQVETALNQRIEELKAQIAEKETAIGAVRDELSETKNGLAESKRELQSVQSQLEAAQADAKNQGGALAASKEEVATLTAQIATLQSERQNAEQALEAKLESLESKRAGLSSELTAKQAELQAAISERDQANNQLEINKNAAARERKEMEAKIAAVEASRAGYVTKVEAVAAKAQELVPLRRELKEYVGREVAGLRSSLEESKEILMNALRMSSNMLKNVMKRYKKEMAERRKYFNLVQELRGNIRVYCRCRPIIAEDKKKGDTNICASFPDENVIKLQTETREKEFEFDRVFDFKSTQDTIFEDTKYLVQSCMDGYNVCIFAYGQTGTGKTYTMGGPPDDRGVNFRALSELFRLREARQGDYSYTIAVEMVEIYNETIRDLLDDSKNANEKKMKIHKGPNGIYVDNLVEREVNSEQDVIDIMATGQRNRRTGVTNMNTHSSRSHMLLTIKVIGVNHRANSTYYGKLHLIDLAGSERVGRSGATGDRLKEAQAINKSLSALGNVIEALQKKQSHIPYRNSKLTFLLQDSLGGHAKTLMFINVSPVTSDAEETFSSLGFAERVRKVELGKAVRTVGSSGSGGNAPAEEKKSRTRPKKTINKSNLKKMKRTGRRN